MWGYVMPRRKWIGYILRLCIYIFEHSSEFFPLLHYIKYSDLILIFYTITWFQVTISTKEQSLTCKQLNRFNNNP